MRTLLIVLLLVGLPLAVFGQVWKHDFVVMDDHLYVSGNPHVRNGLSFANIAWAFTHIHDANWIPLTWISLMIDAELFGDFAGGYHATSLLLHAAATLLLFATLARATGEQWNSGFVAALFAVHPLHVESVAWLPERKDTLSTFFGMLALFAYVERARAQANIQCARRWHMASLIAFVCSLLSKQMFVTLPCLLLLFDYWPLRRIGSGADAASSFASDSARPPDQPAAVSLRSLIVEKLPFVAVALIFSAIVFLVQREGGRGADSRALPSERAYCQCADRDGHLHRANVLAGWIGRLLSTSGSRDFVWHGCRRRRLLDAGHTGRRACWAEASVFASRMVLNLGTLVPVIGLVQIGTQQMADRYTYVPLIGLFIALTWLVPSLVPSAAWRRALLAPLAVGILAALSLAAWRQTAHWRNSVALFEHALAVTKDNAVAHLNLGKARFDLGDIDGAIQQFNEALKISADSATIHGNLGAALHKLGRRDEAAGHLQQAVNLEPNSATARVNFANLLRDQGQIDASIAEYRRAVDIEPQNLIAVNALADALSQAGQLAAAQELLNRAIAAEPDDRRTLINLGIVLNRMGRIDDSVRYLRKAVHLEPDSASAHYNLGAALYSAKQYDEAAYQFETTLRLDPNHREARSSLASALLNRGTIKAEQGRLADALRDFTRARDLAPDDSRPPYNLGTAMALLGDTAGAIQNFELAVKLNPQAAEARYQLGKLLLSTGRRPEAVEQLREAIRLSPNYQEAEEALQRATAPQ